MASQKESISGIEIRHGLITIAQYFPQENSVGSIIIKPMSDASGQDFDGVLKTEFKNLMAEIDFKDQNVAVSLPSEYAIVKKLSLDSDEKDVGEAISWELSQHSMGRSKNIRSITNYWASPPRARQTISCRGLPKFINTETCDAFKGAQAQPSCRRS